MVLAAVAPATVTTLAQDQDPPEHEEGCSGCEAKSKVTIFKRSAPNGVAIWEANAGSINVGTPTVKKKKDGRCKVKKNGDDKLDECEADLDYPCESSVEAVINSVAPNGYISGSAFGGCEAWGAASAAHKTLSASVTGCGAEMTDKVESHNGATCAITLGSQKVELKVWCNHCKHTAN